MLPLSFSLKIGSSLSNFRRGTLMRPNTYRPSYNWFNHSLGLFIFLCTSSLVIIVIERISRTANRKLPLRQLAQAFGDHVRVDHAGPPWHSLLLLDRSWPASFFPCQKRQAERRGVVGGRVRV